MRTHYKAAALVFAFLMLAACAAPPAMPTLQGQAHSTLLDAERVVTQVAITLTEYRQAGIIVAGSSEDQKLKALLRKAGDALDQGWAAFELTNYTDAMGGAKTAKQMYFAIRQDLLKMGGAR